jgi:hypothetical protein
MKEPNGTLVMTTCKCRENTKNLVMTRAYFEDIIRLKVEQEQKRIIAVLNNTVDGYLAEKLLLEAAIISNAIAQIKAGSND